ncbi:MAG: alanyl-tRNA editing protein AlaX [Candidatus Asgardarchaeum californiense]|nr:MAG: alanyl-tRNA editing protein AlaX [Candidatus Asgardarchaeum californiense]
MTELLYMYDSYLKEFDARVTKVEDNKIVLDRTAFHPTTGGIAHDTGIIRTSSGEFNVVDVIIDESTGDVFHVLDTADHGLKPGDEVKGILNWERRYRLMRLHTATHIMAAIMYRDYNAGITGGHIEEDVAKEDYALEKLDRAIFEDVVAKANEVVKQGIEVKIYFMRREEALKIPGIVKLVHKMPPDAKELRIVEIPGVDIQADGGPHVKNTKEIGEIVIKKLENKGKLRKRIYYTVKP